MVKGNVTNSDVRTAWRTIFSALVNNGLDFFLQDEIDTVVTALNKAMDNNK